ncbi:hypothetical protein [Deinococcus sp. KNUC1210]|nr:hypothetical protein [Deinococcus sp. KNUC1210]
MTHTPSTPTDVLRDHAEHTYAHELSALAAADTHPRPRNGI